MVSHPHRPRIIPVLLLRSNGLLHKTVRFKHPKYVGDPRIAVKIFNDKGADEIVVLDIDATPERRSPKLPLIEEIAGEAFMPMAYGGGIRTVDEARKILSLGVEKVVINSAALENPSLVGQIARVVGSQSVVGSIDVKRDLLGRRRVVSESATRKWPTDPVSRARALVREGVGEIFVTSVDRDGTFEGYDVELCESIASVVDVPVIACGGAKTVSDLGLVITRGRASAAAAGSMFVFQGPHRAVLISFPDDASLIAVLGSKDRPTKSSYPK
ncbi:MAG: imidazole glycerol phosphate synthase subunit HisF [Deltaproteobacteria bacterium]|nr:imidazole glycerol phosphate synthase subunit HisF [Deltaproteobacteria bacterium]